MAELSWLAARRIVFVGDEKQLSPICRISPVLLARQQTWLGSSGLSRLEETNDVPAAGHLLSKKRPNVSRHMPTVLVLWLCLGPLQVIGLFLISRDGLKTD